MNAARSPDLHLAQATPLLDTPPTGDFLEDRQLEINQTLAGIIQTPNLVPKGRLRDIYEFTVLNPAAKRQRPILAYAIGEDLGVETELLHGLAAGTELGHAATIIMDDLPAQDDESERRGKATAHIEFTVGEIEVASLHMALLAGRVVSATDSKLQLNGALTDLAASRLSDLCPGQILDLSTFRGPSPRAIKSAEELDEISALKTSPLMELPMLGTVLIARLPGSTSDRITDLLHRYARHYGIAYQVQDDIVDIQKDHGDKPTYVSVLGGIDNAQQWLDEHAGQADAALEELSAEMETARLKEVIAYIGRSSSHR